MHVVVLHAVVLVPGRGAAGGRPIAAQPPEAHVVHDSLAADDQGHDTEEFEKTFIV